MTDNILVSVAWPYANADIHVGNITGAYLPADVFARFNRLKGNRVLMVSGTDAHGTPITVRADAEGITPEEVYRRYHRRFLELFVKYGLAYDLFTTTHTENHFKISQDTFLALKDLATCTPRPRSSGMRPARAASCRTVTSRASATSVTSPTPAATSATTAATCWIRPS